MPVRGRALSILVHADTKVGKSTFGVTSPAPRLLLDAEAAHRFLPVQKRFWNPLTDGPPPVPDGTWDTCVVTVHDYATLRAAVSYLELGQHYFESIVVDSISETQKKCYSPDTELLTPSGWYRIDALPEDVPVAQWTSDEKVEFVHTTDRLKLRYVGDMISMPSVSNDLLVTPDHRQPVRRKHGIGVVRAEDLRMGNVLPLAGVYAGDATVEQPTKDEVKLLAATQADATMGGRTIIWSLKKQRKIKRLTQLLDRLAIERTTIHYDNGFVRIKIKVPLFVDKYMPRKLWEWNALHWSEDVRRVMIEELAYWDGWIPKQGLTQTGAGKPGSRILYSSYVEQNLDVVNAVAAITGYGSVKKHHCVSIVRHTWRSLHKEQVRTSYDGHVYCVSVPSGFVLTRRNGKVTVSGNCKDDVSGGGPEMDQRKWGEILWHMETLIRKLRDLTEHPTRPITSLVLTAMTEQRDGKWRPYVQGQLRTTLPYFIDVVGYMFVRPGVSYDPTQPPPEPSRVLLTRQHVQFEAGERVQGRLPEFIEEPCIHVAWMLESVFGSVPDLSNAQAYRPPELARPQPELTQAPAQPDPYAQYHQQQAYAQQPSQ